MSIASEVERRKVVFGIPDTPVGRVVATLPLAWGWVEDVLQAVILHEGVQYPSCELAAADEIRELLDEREVQV